MMEVCELLAIAPSTWTRSVRPRLPADAIREGRGCAWVHCPSVVRCLLERDAKRSESSGERTESEAVERKRQVEAELLQLKLSRAERTLVEVAEFREVFDEFVDRLRAVGDEAAQAGEIAGSEVQRRINEAVHESERLLEFDQRPERSSPVGRRDG